MRSSARSTKASAAIDRLKKRSGNENYSMSMSSGAMFSLLLATGGGESERLCEPMMMEEFVTFVNAYGPQTPKRVSKLDIEFSKQLTKKSE
ncbi:MAG: hypothetical protein HOO90_04940 [Methylotenera sp.]|uniref:hypothetical protein n=1 Tax=Methylotenera sp. TaxID=2051956 RepID=UPI0017FB69AA|nr:hypothetical protein [Methylotenera sp.]NOU24863.1 hypothetical protein [Methylotenera sp.]